ncbi:MAG: hypothetical protein HRU33_22410 [Rhodobacteraceae bacterium]|nr:hypothetical protein [Paracoccaceae bacterium]
MRVGAMARALEGQCVAAMVLSRGGCRVVWGGECECGKGRYLWPTRFGGGRGRGLAEGALSRPGWMLAEIDLADSARVRADGKVSNLGYWMEQGDRGKLVTNSYLQ